LADPQPDTFASPDFVRAGPPVSVKELDRVGREKWSRVVCLVPEARSGKGHTFAARGPYIIPLAHLRAGADRGSKDAWRFFTHPAKVFPPEAAFFNAPAAPASRGCLGARLAAKTPGGWRLYDEVGAQIEGSEPVAESHAGALGVLRHRALGGAQPLEPAWAPDILELDLGLLELFRLLGALLSANDPRPVALDVLALLGSPGLERFAGEVFDEEDRSALQAVAAAEGLDVVALRATARRFRVDLLDFAKIVEVKDGRGRQAIAELLEEYNAFEAQHGPKIRELAEQIAAADVELAAVKQKILQLQKDEANRSRITKMFSRGGQSLAELKAAGVHAIRTKRALEASYAEIPGYDRLRGLSDRVKRFQADVQAVHALAGKLVELNVGQPQLRIMKELAAKVTGKDDAARAALKAYDLRMRADVLPRVLHAYSLTAYVLRRPDALSRGHSLRSVQRVNTLARHLVEYFRFARYGPKTLGEAFDESWGQVLQLEARLP